MKRISIGSWAYSIGPYASNPVPFDEVVERLRDRGFDGIELGGSPPPPNPDDLPTSAERRALTARVRDEGLEWSGLAANLWGEKLINTDNNSHYISEFQKNLEFCNDLGIQTIRVDTVQPPTIFSEVPEDIARRRVVETWRRCSVLAAGAGLNVVLEVEPGFALNQASGITGIVDGV